MNHQAVTKSPERSRRRLPGPCASAVPASRPSVHGGVPQCLLNLARAIDPRRIEFHVASFDEPSEEMKSKNSAISKLSHDSSATQGISFTRAEPSEAG